MSHELVEPAGLKPMLNSGLYDTLKWIAQIFLPALGVLYFALSQIWGLPAGVEVVGTITAIDLFLGALLSLSNASYQISDEKYGGEVHPMRNPELPPSLVFNAPLSELTQKSEIILKVVPPL